MFVTEGRVAITEHGPIEEAAITPTMDVMFIRARMDYGTVQRVVGAAAKVSGAAKKGQKAKRTIDMNAGEYGIALLVHNVLGWQGPSFGAVPCTPANIERLDPRKPLVKKVLEEINERNNDPDDDEEDADPNVVEGRVLAPARPEAELIAG
jgi:hypothetical protein